MKPILIILPSRGRPNNVKRFYKYWKKNSLGLSDLVIGLDSNDKTLNEYEEHEDMIIDTGKGGSFGFVCNRIFEKYGDYEFYFVVSDDHIIRTYGWEKIFINKLRKEKFGIAYGDDLFQGRNLPTAAFISGGIARAVGYIVPNSLKHMYTDNVWKDLGLGMGKFFYMPSIIIEHMHHESKRKSKSNLLNRIFEVWEKIGKKTLGKKNIPGFVMHYMGFSRGKAPIDENYLRISRPSAVAKDLKEYNAWKKNDLKKDIRKIKKKHV